MTPYFVLGIRLITTSTHDTVLYLYLRQRSPILAFIFLALSGTMKQVERSLSPDLKTHPAVSGLPRLGTMDKFELSHLAVLGTILLVSFLSYSSQYLFGQIEPGPLTRTESVIFNSLVACTWICYARACMTDPGRVYPEWLPEEAAQDNAGREDDYSRIRWCRKCNIPKPPRSHHCKICAR